MKSKQSDRFSHLLQKNRPTPPPGKDGEWNQIAEAIARKSDPTRRFFGIGWPVWVPVAVTAMLLVGIVWFQKTTPPTSNAALAEYMLETYAVLDNSTNGLEPAVGHEWLLLIQ